MMTAVSFHLHWEKFVIKSRKSSNINITKCAVVSFGLKRNIQNCLHSTGCGWKVTGSDFFFSVRQTVQGPRSVAILRSCLTSTPYSSGFDGSGFFSVATAFVFVGSYSCRLSENGISKKAAIVVEEQVLDSSSGQGPGPHCTDY